jgi:hypothetical protein
MNHWYFTEQAVADHRQALVDQATTHRLLTPRAAPTTRRRRLAFPLRLTRRLRKPLPGTNVTSTAPSPPLQTPTPGIAVPLPIADRIEAAS